MTAHTHIMSNGKAPRKEAPVELPLFEEPTMTGQQEMSETIVEYMIRNWSRDQIVEFALKLFGTAPDPDVVQAIMVYIRRKMSIDAQTHLALWVLGDEAQAWWARKEDHQP